MTEVIAKHVMSGNCERCGIKADLSLVVMDYCTQNSGNCGTCSLVNYGKDCRNVPLSEHGARQLVCKHCMKGET
jgi:hypothetical protein